MSVFSKLANTVFDWATGNSISYSKEEEIYSEIMSLIERLEDVLQTIISTGNLSDPWAIIEIDNMEYTLPLLKSLIDEKLKNNINNSLADKNRVLNEIMKLQELYDTYEIKVKRRIVKNVLKFSEFQELYWILIELKKVLSAHMNLEAIKQVNYEVDKDFPSYNVLNKLKITIAERRIQIFPYLSEINYNKGK